MIIEYPYIYLLIEPIYGDHLVFNDLDFEKLSKFLNSCSLDVSIKHPQCNIYKNNIVYKSNNIWKWKPDFCNFWDDITNHQTKSMVDCINDTTIIIKLNNKKDFVKYKLIF